jgi:hypothetical protein
MVSARSVSLRANCTKTGGRSGQRRGHSALGPAGSEALSSSLARWLARGVRLGLAGPGLFKKLRSVAGARRDGVPAALTIPAPTRPHQRFRALGGTPVLLGADEAMASSSLGCPGPGVVLHRHDGTEAVRPVGCARSKPGDGTEQGRRQFSR